MEKLPQQKKPYSLSTIAKAYSGPITHVALAAISAWMIVTGLKGLAGFTVNSLTAFADLVGVILVVALARWFNLKQNAK